MQEGYYKILLIDTDKILLDSLESFLKKAGFEVHIALDAISGLNAAKEILPHAIVIDVNIPIIDGVELCCEIRKISNFQKIFVFFYTLQNNDYTEIAAFEAGADDYIHKTVRINLLVARIKAILNRSGIITTKPIITYGGLGLDREKFLVLKDGQELFLPRREFELLELLFSEPSKIFTRKEISENIWHVSSLKSRTIDVHIRSLRQKLGSNYIKNMKGVGYSLEI